MTPWWGSLLFVIAGAMLSAMTAYLLQRQKRKQDRQDKLADARREALTVLLNWISPLDRTLVYAELQIHRLLNREQHLEDFHSGFNSNVSYQVKPVRYSADQRLVLKTDPYPLIEQLRHEIEKLETLAVELWRNTERAILNRDRIVEQAHETCTLKVGELRQQVEALRQRLVEDYRKTYE